MNSYFPRAVELAKLALLFGRVNRATFHEDGIRPESDTDHTVMLGLIGCDLAYSLNEYYNHYQGHSHYLNPGLVAQFALVHDLVEAYVGDTQSLNISDADKKSKEEREALAAERLREEFGASSWIVSTLLQYEALATPEARFIKVLDKVMPKLTHMHNACVGAKTIPGMSHETFVMAHQKQYKDLKKKFGDVDSEVFQLLFESMVACENEFQK